MCVCVCVCVCVWCVWCVCVCRGGGVVQDVGWVGSYSHWGSAGGGSSMAGQNLGGARPHGRVGGLAPHLELESEKPNSPRVSGRVSKANQDTPQQMTRVK